MIQTPSPFATEPELDIPPAVVFNDPPPKSKSKLPIWLIILFVIGLLLSLSITAFIVFSRTQKPTSTARPRTVVITTTPLPTQEVPSASASAQQAPAVKRYTNDEFKISFEYPAEWDADNTSIPPAFFGASGAVYTKYEDNTVNDIDTWFEEKYPEGAPDAPKLVTTYTNKNKVLLLQTTVQSDIGPLKYFFKSGTQVISLSFSTSNDPNIDKSRLVIYGRIVDSLTTL